MSRLSEFETPSEASLLSSVIEGVRVGVSGWSCEGLGWRVCLFPWMSIGPVVGLNPLSRAKQAVRSSSEQCHTPVSASLGGFSLKLYFYSCWCF